MHLPTFRPSHLDPNRAPTLQKICIIGCAGAGKSTLAKALGQKLGLPVYHLDCLYWHAGWTPTERTAWLAQQAALCAQPQWIVDGHYGSTLDIRLQHSDTVIFLDMPRWLCLLRVVWRTVRHWRRSRDDLAPGCPEKLDWAFLRWIWNFPATQRPDIARTLSALPPDKTLIVLNRPRAVNGFLHAL